jgi:hypothetical protein
MADTILFNGRITTLDPSKPTATAVAIFVLVAWYDLRERYLVRNGGSSV